MEKYSVKHTIETEGQHSMIRTTEYTFMSALEIFKIMGKSKSFTLDFDGKKETEGSLSFKVYGYKQVPAVKRNDEFEITLKAYDVNEIM